MKRPSRTGQWIALVLIVFLFGVWKSLREGTQSRRPEPAVEVRITREPSNGITQAMMGEAFLRASEKTAIKLIAETVAEIPDAAGQEVVATANYAAAGPNKIAVVLASIAGRQRMTIILSPIGNEFVTVFCAVDFADEVPLSSGPCSQAIRQVFGGGLIFY
jgi:hypothetical protein